MFASLTGNRSNADTANMEIIHLKNVSDLLNEITYIVSNICSTHMFYLLRVSEANEDNIQIALKPLEKI